MIQLVQSQPSKLRGLRILVVEDEYMIAQEIAEALETADAQVLGPVSRISDAVRLVEAEERIDGAMLDVNLGHEAVWPLVDHLLARGVPLMLATGYDASAIPKAYAHLPRREKPATAHDLTRTLAEALAPATPHESLNPSRGA